MMPVFGKLDIPPICQTDKCGRYSQILAKMGDNKTYMKNCCRHSYKDITEEKERNRNNK
jgi:hypothetical protein